jgi:16S rRNA (cytidine1402-2'-O)-methyltransferase
VTGPGTLVVCGAPIGDPASASPRLAAALAGADVLAAEDTRRLPRLAAALGADLPGRVVSYHDHNEATRAGELLAELRAGRTVALITDAGMPGVSDPGYRLVAAAAAAGVPVTVVPGPSAVTAALAVSGLPTDRWVMEGFLPRRPGPRRARLEELARERRTLVLLEAPHRLAATLAAAAAAFGADRPAVVCRELTKTHEEIVRGGVGELARWAAEREVRGEVTVVLAGASAAVPGAADPAELAAAVTGREAAGLSRREAIADVATDLGRPRREVYAAVVAARAGRGSGPRPG